MAITFALEMKFAGDAGAWTAVTADLLQALAAKLHPRFGGIRRTWLNPPPRIMLPFVEDAITFQDNFTEASDTVLDSHTPSPTGTSWVLVSQITQTISVIAATDDIRITAGASGTGALYKSQPDPAVNEYDVQFTFNALNAGDANNRCRLHGRMTDANNYYALRIEPAPYATDDCELVKNVANTITVLAAVETSWIVTDTAMLRMLDAAKSVRKNGAEVLTNSDNALTAAGSAGVSIGKFLTGSNDTGASVIGWRFDDYLVDEVAAGGDPEGSLVGGKLIRGGLLGHGVLTR